MIDDKLGLETRSFHDWQIQEFLEAGLHIGLDLGRGLGGRSIYTDRSKHRIALVEVNRTNDSPYKVLTTEAIPVAEYVCFEDFLNHLKTLKLINL